MLRSRALWSLGVSAIVLSASIANPVAQAPLPTFEVASVKANTSSATSRSFGIRGDSFQAVNVSVREMLMVAYGEPGAPGFCASCALRLTDRWWARLDEHRPFRRQRQVSQ